MGGVRWSSWSGRCRRCPSRTLARSCTCPTRRTTPPTSLPPSPSPDDSDSEARAEEVAGCGPCRRRATCGQRRRPRLGLGAGSRLTESSTEPADFGAPVPSMSKLRHPLCNVSARSWRAEGKESPDQKMEGKKQMVSQLLGCRKRFKTVRAKKKSLLFSSKRCTEAQKHNKIHIDFVQMIQIWRKSASH